MKTKTFILITLFVGLYLFGMFCGLMIAEAIDRGLIHISTDEHISCFARDMRCV